MKVFESGMEGDLCYHIAYFSLLLFRHRTTGQIAANHVGMCAVLCANETPCFGTKDALRYLAIERVTIARYMLSTALYLFVIAVPVAGA